MYKFLILIVAISLSGGVLYLLNQNPLHPINGNDSVQQESIVEYDPPYLDSDSDSDSASDCEDGADCDDADDRLREESDSSGVSRPAVIESEATADFAIEEEGIPAVDEKPAKSN